MLKNSLFISFLTWLATAVKESYIFSLIERFIFFVSESYSKSFTKKILTGNGAIEDKHKDTSVFYKISSFVLSPFYKAAEKISSLFKESLIFNIFSKSAIVSFIFSVPFLCCVMFIVIHDSWNNLYALVLSGLAFFMSAEIPYVPPLAPKRLSISENPNPEITPTQAGVVTRFVRFSSRAKTLEI